jgi:hypothetical protein
MDIHEAIIHILNGKTVVATEELMGEKLFLKIGKDDRIYTTGEGDLDMEPKYKMIVALVILLALFGTIFLYQYLKNDDLSKRRKTIEPAFTYGGFEDCSGDQIIYSGRNWFCYRTMNNTTTLIQIIGSNRS